MARLDMGYVITTASLCLGMFFLGRWSAPTPRPRIVIVPGATVTQVEQSVIPLPRSPLVTPMTTATTNQKLPANIKSYSLEPELPVEHTAPVIAPLPVASVAMKPALEPEHIVLEEIPDNPYKRNH